MSVDIVNVLKQERTVLVDEFVTATRGAAFGDQVSTEAVFGIVKTINAFNRVISHFMAREP